MTTDDDREMESLIYEIIFGEPQPMTNPHPEQDNLDSYNARRIENGKPGVSMEFFLRRKQRFQPVAPLVMLNPNKG